MILRQIKSPVFFSLTVIIVCVSERVEWNSTYRLLRRFKFDQSVNFASQLDLL